MDERLEKALDFSNYMVTLNNQKRLLGEQYQQQLIYYFNGGQFSATQELVSFCNALILLGQTETVLVDDNNIPVFVQNLEEFLSDILQVYASASNQYFTEYETLKKNRSIKGIVDL
jgi:hypothetical protein